MSKGKKVLAVILTILGSIVALVGAVFLIAWVDMGISENISQGDMEAYLVLGAILLVSVGVVGILPLVAGIKMLLKNRKLKKK